LNVTRVLRRTLLGLQLSFLLLAGPLAFAGNQPSTPAPGQGKVVFVQNFELDAENFQSDSSLVSKLPEGPLPRPHVIRGKKEDPATQVQKIVNTMSNDLLKDLEKEGFTARRLLPGDPPPSDGWLLHGVFTEVDEGNRVRRAVIGFGAGAAKMSLYADVSDLSHPNQPLYALADNGTSGKMPGAAITMSPVAAGVKFAMEKNADSKAIKKTAEQIVDELVKKMSPAVATASK